jgi:hypothetical protein
MMCKRGAGGEDFVSQRGARVSAAFEWSGPGLMASSILRPFQGPEQAAERGLNSRKAPEKRTAGAKQAAEKGLNSGEVAQETNRSG